MFVFFTPLQVTISLVFSILAILGTVVAAIIFIRTLVAHPYHYMMYQDPYNDNDTDVVEEHYVSYQQQKTCE